jgi:hypothetical protein
MLRASACHQIGQPENQFYRLAATIKKQASLGPVKGFRGCGGIATENKKESQGSQVQVTNFDGAGMILRAS